MTIIRPTGRFRGVEVVNAARKHLEPAELTALFEALQQRGPFWYGYFRVQYYFGCRVSEVALILKEDVSFAEKAIIIRRLKKKQFDKHQEKVSDGFSENLYGLTPRIAEVITEVLAVAPRKNPWLFGSTRAARQTQTRMGTIRIAEGPDGKLYKAIGRSWADSTFRAAATQAQLPEHLAHTHVLRHTRATLMLAGGAAPEHVKYLLGHSSLGTTNKYLGIARSMRDKYNTPQALGVGDLEDDAETK